MKLLATLSILFFCTVSISHAANVTLKTVDGKIVNVTEDSISEAYLNLMNSKVNLATKNADGTTAFLNPAVTISGKFYSAAYVGGSPFFLDYATGFCKNNGFTSSSGFSLPDGNLPVGAVAFFTAGGSISQYRDFSGGNEFRFAGIICK